jgi:hypothetical protein
MPPPVPPSVNDGRMIAGNPVSSRMPNASSSVATTPPLATFRPMRSIASLNSRRSSAIAIARAVAPISSTPQRSSAPELARAIATFSAVWPPIVGRSASGRSRSMINSTTSGVTGSMYVRSASSGSVMIVAGLELTRTTSYPSSRSALVACVPECALGH